MSIDDKHAFVKGKRDEFEVIRSFVYNLYIVDCIP